MGVVVAVLAAGSARSLFAVWNAALSSDSPQEIALLLAAELALAVFLLVAGECMRRRRH
jgi:hypothetical protein